MKAEDLRVGNWLLNFLGEEFQVNKETIYNWGNTEFPNPTPIPLNEDRLLKFGFIKDELEDDDWLSPFDRKRLVLRFNQNGGDQINTYWQENIGIEYASLTFDIKYVHQLQNLFFCLLEKELTITHQKD